MHLGRLFNAPQTVTLAGRPFKAGQLTYNEWAVVQQWIVDNVPGPLATLRHKDYVSLPDEERRHIRLQAYKDNLDWPPAPGSFEWNTAINRGGMGALFFAVLSKHQPITRDEAEALAEASSLEEGLRLLVAAMGVDMQESADPTVPKDGGPNRKTRRAAKARGRGTTSPKTSPSS